MTWFRRMEKQGHQIHWIDGEKTMEEKVSLIKTILEKSFPVDENSSPQR
jgi:tRNA dimethylallyltransferase